MIAPGVRGRLLGRLGLGTGVPLLGVIVVGVVGLTKSGRRHRVPGRAPCIFLGVVAIAVGLLATLFAARRSPTR